MRQDTGKSLTVDKLNNAYYGDNNIEVDGVMYKIDNPYGGSAGNGEPVSLTSDKDILCLIDCNWSGGVCTKIQSLNKKTGWDFIDNKEIKFIRITKR